MDFNIRAIWANTLHCTKCTYYLGTVCFSYLNTYKYIRIRNIYWSHWDSGSTKKNPSNNLKFWSKLCNNEKVRRSITFQPSIPGPYECVSQILHALSDKFNQPEHKTSRFSTDENRQRLTEVHSVTTIYITSGFAHFCLYYHQWSWGGRI